MRIVIASIGFAAIAFAQSYVAEGRLIGGGANEGLSIEASEGGGKMSHSRAMVNADSSFRIELPANGKSWEFRVVSRHGEVIQVIHHWPQRGIPIELRLAEVVRKPVSQAAISYQRLSFRPSSKLRQAFAKSQKLRTSGRKAESTAALQEIVKSEPAWFEAWVELGTSQAVLGEGAAAAESLRRALVIDPNAAEVYPFLGFALLRPGQIGEAARVAEKGLELKPDCLKSKYILGMAMASDRQPSRRALELLVDSQTQFPEAMIAIAALFLRFGEFAESRDAAWRYLHMAQTPRAELAGSIWREASLALQPGEAH